MCMFVSCWCTIARYSSSWGHNVAVDYAPHESLGGVGKLRCGLLQEVVLGYHMIQSGENQYMVSCSCGGNELPVLCLSRPSRTASAAAGADCKQSEVVALLTAKLLRLNCAGLLSLPSCDQTFVQVRPLPKQRPRGQSVYVLGAARRPTSSWAHIFSCLFSSVVLGHFACGVFVTARLMTARRHHG